MRSRQSVFPISGGQRSGAYLGGGTFGDSSSRRTPYFTKNLQEPCTVWCDCSTSYVMWCVSHFNTYCCLNSLYRLSWWIQKLVLRPSVAGTLTLKHCSGVRQNTPFSFRILKNFLGRKQQTPRQTPLPAVNRALRRLDRRAQSLASPLSQNPKYATGDRPNVVTVTSDFNRPKYKLL